MHYDTYMRLFWKHHEAEMEQLSEMSQWLNKLEEQMS
jgi:hypothetical protein